jgi:hypothetical protein
MAERLDAKVSQLTSDWDMDAWVSVADSLLEPASGFLLTYLDAAHRNPIFTV